MVNISEPYVIHYPRIVAVARKDGMRVELIEFFECVGGAMWSKCNYAKSPIVEEVRCVGNTMRYLVKSGSVDLALEGSGSRREYQLVLWMNLKLPSLYWSGWGRSGRCRVPFRRCWCPAEQE